jgi:hypothetical protein
MPVVSLSHPGLALSNLIACIYTASDYTDLFWLRKCAIQDPERRKAIDAHSPSDRLRPLVKPRAA